MKVMIVLEYIIVFVVVYLFYYFLVIRKNTFYDKNNLPVELLYLKKVYRVVIRKEDYRKFVYIYTFINTFIISFIYIILIYLLNDFIFRIIVGIILLVLMIIICYGLLGRYYLRKEGR